MKKVLKQSTLIFLLNSISIAFLCLILTAFLTVVAQNKSVNQCSRDRYDLSVNTNRFLDGSAYLTDEVRAYASSGEQVHYDNYWNEINNLKNRDIGYANMKEIGLSQQEQLLIDAMSTLSNSLIPLEESAMATAAQGDIFGAISIVYGPEYSEGVAQIASLRTQLLEEIQGRTDQEIKLKTEKLRVFEVVILSFVALVVAFQVLTYLVVRKKVTVPLKLVQEEMGQIANGKLSSVFPLEADTSEMGMLIGAIHETKDGLRSMILDIQRGLGEIANKNLNIAPGVDYKGDFVALCDSISVIIVSLSEILQQIGNGSDEVSVGADQVATGAQSLAQGTTEQAGAVEQLSEQIGKVTQQVTNTAQRATRASEQAETVGGEATQSNRRMQDMVKAMEDISTSASQIGNIIKTIEDIAFQTNILALNAAVEAARAGEAGKGFAVVAGEVRNLAAKSAEASKSTADLIESSLLAVERGVAIADETAQSLESVVTGVQAVSTTIAEISTDTHEQANSIQQITTGVTQISDVVQMNSATAEESAAASEELSAQALLLKGLVGQFSLLKA